MPRPVLVSSCLLGLLTRYDGTTKRNDKVMRYIEENELVPIPVCPEQLAGLPTPRAKTFFRTGDGADVLNDSGEVVNEHGVVMNSFFVRGARESAKIARLTGCTHAIFKERSPSCGVHAIYVGDTITKGMGVSTALLDKMGLAILSEEDL